MKHIITSAVMYSAIAASSQTPAASSQTPAPTDTASIREMVDSTVVTDYRLKGLEIRLGGANLLGLFGKDTETTTPYKGGLLELQVPLKRFGDKNVLGLNAGLEIYGLNLNKIVLRTSGFVKRILTSWAAVEGLLGISSLGNTGVRGVVGVAFTGSLIKGVGIRVEVLGKTNQLFGKAASEGKDDAENKDDAAKKAKEAGKDDAAKKETTAKKPVNETVASLFEVNFSVALSNALIG